MAHSKRVSLVITIYTQNHIIFSVELLKPPENPAVNVRSSGEEMMANMQSLLDVEDSINVSRN